MGCVGRGLWIVRIGLCIDLKITQLRFRFSWTSTDTRPTTGEDGRSAVNAGRSCVVRFRGANIVATSQSFDQLIVYAFEVAY